MKKKTGTEKEKAGIKIRRKRYKLNNPEKLKAEKRRYYERHREEINLYRNTRRIQRRKIDPLYKITERIRKLISASLHKKEGKCVDILGCSYDEFKKYIESQFKEWMNWDNHGKYDGNYNHGWDLDHIVPVTSGKTPEDVYKLNHFSNFQPLCSRVNRCDKRDKLGWREREP